MRLLLWIAVIGFLFAPAYYLSKAPEDFTPVVATLLNAFLFLATFAGSRMASTQDAEWRANDRWLPQAESACHRLLSLSAAVKSYRNKLIDGCTDESLQPPELRQVQHESVRVFYRTQCREGAERLADIANHLENALADWERFISHNCRLFECERISHEIEQLRTRLDPDTTSDAVCAVDS